MTIPHGFRSIPKTGNAVQLPALSRFQNGGVSTPLQGEDETQNASGRSGPIRKGCRNRSGSGRSSGGGSTGGG